VMWLAVRQQFRCRSLPHSVIPPVPRSVHQRMSRSKSTRGAPCERGAQRAPDAVVQSGALVTSTKTGSDGYA
jgi:hypothetical protein